MRIVICIAIAYCFLSCKQDKRFVAIFKSKGFVLFDTSFAATDFLKYNGHEYKFPIYYIGKPRDTIKIGRSYEKFRTKWANDFKMPLSKEWSFKTLTLFVDTTITTTVTHEYVTNAGEILDDSSEHYKAYPLAIKNITDTAIWLGYTFSLTYLNREIKDNKGKWIRPDSTIDKTAICGTNQPRLILKPGEMLIAKVKRYKGNVVKDCRFAFGYENRLVYSNIFKDSVDEKMFHRK